MFMIESLDRRLLRLGAEQQGGDRRARKRHKRQGQEPDLEALGEAAVDGRAASGPAVTV